MVIYIIIVLAFKRTFMHYYKIKAAMSDFNFPSNLGLHFDIIQAQNTGQNTDDHVRNVVVYDT